MAKKKSQRNDRKTVSFKARYNMTRSEWATKKKELRAAGLGSEIDLMYKKVVPNLC